MENYEEKYKEALERAEKAFNETESGITIGVLEEIFPELKESEDERIRKGLIEFLKNASGGFLDTKIQCKTFGKWLAWLEKQGEKLPVGFYYVNSEGKKFYSDTFKYGDVTLHVEKQGEQKPMTEEFEHELAEICNQLLSEIDSEWMNNEILNCIGTSVWLNLCDETAKRYKDGLLKLAKQGEQKPAWSEEDETTFKVMLEELEKYVMFKQYSTPLSVYDLQWFKSLKDRVQPQPKQEWSEEDENTINALINLVKMYHGDCIDMPEKNRLLNWLVALTGRIK